MQTVDLDWDAMLATVMAGMGKRVTVSLMGSPEDAREPAMLASFSGTLAAGHDIGTTDNEVQMLHFKEDPGSGFMLDRQHFQGCGWYDENETCLLILIGRVGLLVDFNPEV